jgi:uncharacterized protein YeeX (DUF496 family)
MAFQHSQSTPLDETTLRDLLQTVAPKSRASLLSIANDSDISYLIIFESHDRKKRQIVPAGKEQDFRNPQDAIGRVYKGLRAVTFVNLKQQRDLDRSIPTTQSKGMLLQPSSDTIEPLKKLEMKVTRLEMETRRLEDVVGRARKRLNERAEVISELKAQLSEKRHYADNLFDEVSENSSETTTKRHEDLEKAEEELISRMDDYMVKEAELEQREQDLAYLEQKVFRNAG